MKKLKTVLFSTKTLLIVASLLVATVVLLGSALLLNEPRAEASTPLNLTPYRADAATQAAPTPTLAAQSDAPEAVALAQTADVAAPTQQDRPLLYTGNVLADKRVPIVVEVIGQVLRVNVEVGDHVKAGDVLLQIDNTSLEAQRAQALAGVQAAQAQLDGLLLDADASDVEAAQAAINAAQSAYQKALDGPTQEDLDIAESQVRQAQAAVDRAQAAYDRVSWNPAITALPESQQLEQATLQLEAAQAQYEKIQQGATADVINGAYAQVVAAQAQLDRLLKGATKPQLDAAQAQIDQAENALYLAQLQLDKATVHAPMDGVISAVNTAVGAYAAPGGPVFEILSEDVKIVIPVEETRLAQVAVGDPATVQVNAYPDRTFDGEVITIAPELNASTRTADVTIRPSDDQGLLSPGMFATVELGR